MATAKEHMQQQLKNVWSTQIKVEAEVDIGATTGECHFITTPLALTCKTF